MKIYDALESLDSLAIDFAEGTSVSIERRGERRQMLRVPITIDSDERSGISGSILDASHMGLRLRASERLPIGGRIRVTMDLPSRRLQGYGEVVRRVDSTVSPGSCSCGVQLEAPLRSVDEPNVERPRPIAANHRL